MTDVLVLAAAVAGGTAATWLFDDEASTPARLAMGVPLGMVGLGLFGFVLGWAAGLGAGTVLAAAALVLGLPVAALWRAGLLPAVPEGLRRDRAAARAALARPGRTLPVVLFYAVLLTLMTHLLDRAFFEAPGGGGVFTGVDHNLGDLPFHLAIATSFVYGGNFPPEHPELSGTRLTYPFVVDLVAAMLMAVGAGAARAFRLENLALGWALVGLLHRFGLKLTRDRLAALVAPWLVLASGGLGFLLLGRDVDPTLDGLSGLLRRPVTDYTIHPQGPFRWGNLVITMLIPQRSFLLGMPLFLLLATLWWQAVTSADRARARRWLLAAGVITGLSPLAHAHAFSTALAVGAALALLFPDRRAWLGSLGLAVLLAAPQLLLIASGTSMQPEGFLGWHLGWDRGDTGLLRFWWLNLGLFIPALLAALLWRGRRPVVEAALLRFYLPFACCFVVPNLVRLSPWIWDNIKFLVWWHVASAPLVALLLARLWRAGGEARAAAALLLVLLTLSGALDLWRTASRSNVQPVVLPEGTAFADEMRALVPPGAIVLHAPTYNSEVYLTGRRSFIGYFGHIWSQGLDGGTRETDVKRFYAGDPALRDLPRRAGAGFVLVGPFERVIEGFSEEAVRDLPLLAERGPYRLYGAP